MKTLDRQKLDVVNKTRSNIFGWRGQFTPEFVEYLLDEANEGTGLVVDPFCGSGTVLQACAARNRAAHGFEINPAAYAMSRFFTLSKLSHDERMALLRSFHVSGLKTWYFDTKDDSRHCPIIRCAPEIHARHRA